MANTVTGDKESPKDGRKKVPVAATVGGVVAVVGAAVAVLAMYPPEWVRMALDPVQTTATHVNNCVDKHDLRVTPSKEVTEYTESQTSDTGKYSRTIYAACAWPATNSTESDGYTEIVVSTVVGFGESESSSATVFDRIQASCSEVELIYNRAGMGEHGPQPPVRLKRGEVAYAAEGKVDPYTGPWQTSAFGGVNVPYPDPSEIVVLHNGRRVLSSAQCV